MRGGVVVPDVVERGFLELPSAKFRACQSIDADAPDVRKWPV